MAINQKQSYSEYTVSTPQGDFAIGFEDYNEGEKDRINVTVDGEDAVSKGYTVLRKNALTIAMEPFVPSGIVRLTRETNIDNTFYTFTAGAIFDAANVDANFAQVLHSQQEVRDRQTYVENRVLPLVDGLEDALAAAEEASQAAQAAADAAAEAAEQSRSAENVIYGDINQKIFNDLTRKIMNPLTLNFTPAQLQADFVGSLNTWIATLSSQGGGTIYVPAGLYKYTANKSIILKDNITLVLDANAVIELEAYNLGLYNMFSIQNVKNVHIYGGIINGRRDLRTALNTGVAYVQRKPNTAYAVGAYVTHERYGFIVKTAGTSSSATNLGLALDPKEPSNPNKIGNDVTDGTVVYTVIEDVGEWGMGINVSGADNVSLNNIQINNCWGDALYIGSTPSLDKCTNLVINNVRMDNNRRQGISVISAEGLDINNCSATNTNGTAPAAAIDIENNTTTQVLKDINITNFTSKNNEGNSLHLWLDKFDATAAHKVSITVNGWTDTGSRNGFYIGKVLPNVKGSIDVYKFNAIDWRELGVKHEAIPSTGIQCYFHKPSFSTDKALAAVRSGYANSATIVCGGLHLINPSFEYRGATKYETPIIVSNTSVNTLGFNNISVIDPYRLDSSNAGTIIQINDKVANLELSDRYGQSRRNLNGHVYNTFQHYYTYYVDAADTAWRSLTIGTIRKGRKFRIISESTTQRAVLNLASNITVYGWSTGVATTSVEIPINEEVFVEAIEDNIVRIRATSGVVNKARNLSVSVTLPALAAGDVYSTTVDMPIVKVGDNVTVGTTMDLGGVVPTGFVRANGKVQLFFTNGTHATKTGQTGTITIKL